MAKVKSLFQIEGGLSDLCFYQLNGKPVVRTIGKIPKERYQKSPAFCRMRENNAEFGAASQIAKTIRLLFAPYSKTFADPYISGRLSGVIRNMISKGIGEPGKRTFEVLKNKSLIEGFEFNRKLLLGQVFHAPFTLKSNAQRNAVEFTFPGNWTDHIAAPTGATHLRLICAIATLSNYSFNGHLYEPTNTALNGLNTVEVSAEIPLNEFAIDLILNPKLPGMPIISPDVGLITCLGITFLQKVNGVFYPLAEGRVMKVIGVF